MMKPNVIPMKPNVILMKPNVIPMKPNVIMMKPNLTISTYTESVSNAFSSLLDSATEEFPNNDLLLSSGANGSVYELDSTDEELVKYNLIKGDRKQKLISCECKDVSQCLEVDCKEVIEELNNIANKCDYFIGKPEFLQCSSKKEYSIIKWNSKLYDKFKIPYIHGDTLYHLIVTNAIKFDQFTLLVKDIMKALVGINTNLVFHNDCHSKNIMVTNIEYRDFVFIDTDNAFIHTIEYNEYLKYFDAVCLLFRFKTHFPLSTLVSDFLILFKYNFNIECPYSKIFLESYLDTDDYFETEFLKTFKEVTKSPIRSQIFKKLDTFLHEDTSTYEYKYTALKY